MGDVTIADTEAGKFHWESPNKLKVKDAAVKGLTLTKTIAAGNKGNAMAIFRNKYNIAPGVDLKVNAIKPEGKGGSIYFKITAKFNKGGYVKKYAKGGGVRKVKR